MCHFTTRDMGYLFNYRDTVLFACLFIVAFQKIN